MTQEPLPPSSPSQAPGSGTEPPGALDPSELARVLLEAEHPAPSPEAPASTVVMPVRELDLAQGQDAVPPAGAGDTLSLPLLPGGTPARKAASRGKWLVLGACLLVLAGAGTYWALRPAPPQDPMAAAEADLAGAAPPELRPYLDQAAKGDGKAMHMIALMYWNGLNVKQDRVKGLAWYRKAVAAGDQAAQQELSVIEGK